MMGHMARGAAAYQEVAVTSRSPLELVVMLYDGALGALRQAGDAMRRRDLITKRDAMNKALRIVQHLQSTLNMDEGAEIAVRLDHLYGVVIARVVEANVTASADLVDDAIALLQPVREAWAQVAAAPLPDVARVPASSGAPVDR